MMAATTVRDEPSMEEILASIRKIISEQEPEPAAAPQPRRQADAPQRSAPVATAQMDAEVLELTTVLNDDGTITDLASMGEDMLADDFDSMVAEAVAQADKEQADVAAALEDVAADLADFSNTAPEFDEGASEFGDEDATPAEEADAPDFGLADMGTPDEFAAAETTATAEMPAVSVPAATASLAAPTAQPAAAGGFAEALAPVVTEAAQTAILSSQAVDRSLSALSELRSAMQASLQPSGPSVTLEDLTRELLRPMLKSWLDENLPPLVERIVKEEVRRITGSAV